MSKEMTVDNQTYIPTLTATIEMKLNVEAAQTNISYEGEDALCMALGKEIFNTIFKKEPA